VAHRHRAAALPRPLAASQGDGRARGDTGELGEGPREAIILFHIEELSYRDIAAALEVPMGTVMTWLHRGRAQLKRALDEAPIA